MKSLARHAATCSESHEIRVDDSASFATVGTQCCVYGGSLARARSLRLASLCLGAYLAMTIGCARIQPTVAEAPRTENPRQNAIDQMVDASVKVALDRDGRHVMFGSGVVVASHPAGTQTEAISYVLTAAHVVAAGDGATISVGLPSITRACSVAILAMDSLSFAVAISRSTSAIELRAICARVYH